ncbi:unnamed protein product [Cyprideis torosa]|uniref:Uncharacterized protein n=1 Tax=Cyprideis torosa TaxID=163714 RepID=A0A7R8WA83_9CRUS|nr:unnamed protein product [Cyprideis torosa]CAG0885179.1 unnamed protein product [Cyprideis torosa]
MDLFLLASETKHSTNKRRRHKRDAIRTINGRSYSLIYEKKNKKTPLSSRGSEDIDKRLRPPRQPYRTGPEPGLEPANGKCRIYLSPKPLTSEPLSVQRLGWSPAMAVAREAAIEFLILGVDRFLGSGFFLVNRAFSFASIFNASSLGRASIRVPRSTLPSTRFLAAIFFRWKAPPSLRVVMMLRASSPVAARPLMSVFVKRRDLGAPVELARVLATKERAGLRTPADTASEGKELMKRSNGH